MFGFSNSKKDDAKAGGKFGLPGLSLGKAEKALDKSLGKTSGTLKNTGEKVEDFLFGPKDQKNKNELTIGLPGFGSVSENTGGKTGSSSSLAGTFNKVGGDLNKAGSAIQKTGEETIDFLFGNNKKKVIVPVPTESTKMPGFALPGLSFGATRLPSLSDVAKKVNKDMERAGHKIEKTGKKVVEYLFGGGMKKQTTPGLTFGQKDLNLGFTVTEKANATTLPKLSLGATTLFAQKDTGTEIDNSLKKIGSGVEKTGEKVVDYLFGGKPKTTIQPGLGVTGANEKLPNFTSSLGATSVTKIHDETSGKIVEDLFGGRSKTTGYGSDGLGANGLNEKLPKSIGGDMNSSHLPNTSGTTLPYFGSTRSPGTTNVTTKIQVNLGKLENVAGKSGEKVVDFILGGGNTKPTKIVDTQDGKTSNHSSNSLPSFSLGVTKPSVVSNTTTVIGKDLGNLGEGNKVKSSTPNTNLAKNMTNGDGRIGINDLRGITLPASPGVIPKIGENVQPITEGIGIGKTTVRSISNTTDAEIPDISSRTNSKNNGKFEVNTNTSPINSLEESVDGLVGVSEMPINGSTKSEEALRKIEDILQGSGKITISQPKRTEQNFKKKEEEISGKPRRISTYSHGFTYTNEVSSLDSTTAKQKTRFNTSIIEGSEKSTTSKSGSVILPPYFVVPDTNSSIGEQFTPELPPTAFDKPTAGKAPFIPILPPPMESTIRNIITPSPTKTSNTLAPPITAAPSKSLTPVEYGAIGVGSVLLFALIAYIYQKYKQYRTSSVGGSYSPKTHHRNTAGRKRSTRSNDSEEGQSLDLNEAKETTTTQVVEINSEVIVVDIAPEIKATEEVIEMPITKTVVNGLQKSSTNDNQQTLTTSGKSEDSIEIISEKHKFAMEKPPRKTKTPTNSPEKFTSDKTSASQLNQDSLKTVSQAIGGILRSQVPNKEVPEDSCSDSSEKGVSLLGKLVESTPLRSTLESNDGPLEESNAASDKTTSEVTEEAEVDGGSEYFSADENSDSKHSPPLSPSLRTQFETFKTRNLRAEDVYNTEIITEDGRRSIEDDIAESIEHHTLDTTIVAPSSEDCEDCRNEPLQPSVPVLFSEDAPVTGDDTDDSRRKINQNEVSNEIYIQNLINAEKSDSQRFKKEEAEAIVEEIIRASQLDSVTLQSIRQDLGTSTETKSKVKWSDNIQFCGHTNPEQYTTNTMNVHLGTPGETDNRINIDEGKPTYLNNSSHCLANAMSSEHSELENMKIQDIANTDDQKNILSCGPIEGTSKLENANCENEPSAINCTINDATELDHSNESRMEERTDEDFGEMDEGFPVEHRFEFIPPKQPQIFEDDLIVFSNSDQESISTLSNSTVESNPPHEEQRSSNNKGEDEVKATNSNYALCEECGGIQTEESLANGSNGLEKENGVEQNRTKWYVPNDETTDDVIDGEEKPAEDLYIVLSEEVSKPPPCRDFTPLESTSSNKPDEGNRNFSNISYAYIDVKDDPRNEGWPEHLPKNIHSISGVGLIRTTEVAPLSRNVLKEEEVEIFASTSVDCKSDTNMEECRRGAGSPSGTIQKPIPKFIIPNMDSRLSKKRPSRRRQIKSLDSGVHHYYGEYLNLVEFPEIEAEGGEKMEKVIEDVITIKPDGTITEEKIVIQNLH